MKNLTHRSLRPFGAWPALAMHPWSLPTGRCAETFGAPLGQADLPAGGIGRSRRGGGETGGITVLIAVSVVCLLGMTALVVDGGRLYVAHAELQTVADLAAKSGARELARVYMDEGRADPTSDALSPSEQQRVATAVRERALKNHAGGAPISIVAGDVQVGKWDDASAKFVQTSTGVTSVQVMARRDSTANGEVPVFFAGVFGESGIPVRAVSATRISGIRYLPPGTADFPVAISKAWYASHASPCSTNNTIKFEPTGSADGCAGWHTFQETPASAAALKKILNGLRVGTFKSPAIEVGDTEFMFTGGTDTSAITELKNLYNAKKNAAGEMAVLIPVYDSDNCSNPNGWIRIVGVARAVVTRVETAPAKLVEARVQCDVIELGESGGPDFGVLAAGPDMVR